MIKQYGYVRIGTSVPKMEVANVPYNIEEIKQVIEKAELKQIQLLVFPELCITGASCGDLYLQDSLVESAKNGLSEIQNASIDYNGILIVGFPLNIQYHLYNVFAVIQKGKVLGFVPKFVEQAQTRYFENDFTKLKEVIWNGEKVPFSTNLIFQDFEDTKFSFMIDGVDPLKEMRVLNAPIQIHVHARESVVGNADKIKKALATTSYQTTSCQIYVSASMYESTSDYVYSGNSFICEEQTGILENKPFSLQNELLYQDIDVTHFKGLQNNYYDTLEKVEVEISDKITELSYIPCKTPLLPVNKEDYEETLKIQTMALAKRLYHTKINHCVLGISGGLDSTLAFLVTVKAFELLHLPIENIIAVTMPGFGTTDRTYQNACELVKEYGATLKGISIVKSCLQHFEDIGHFVEDHTIVYENAQARERTQILMDIANQVNGLVVGTGDLSELALGFCTYNGDHMSMYNVNAGIPKTMVRRLVETVALQTNSAVLKDILATPISPELLPTNKGKLVQKTESSIGPYILHDYFLYHFLKLKESPDKILFLATLSFQNEFTESEIKHWLLLFIKRFFTQQFKKNCVPDGPSVLGISLSPRCGFLAPSDASYKVFVDMLEGEVKDGKKYIKTYRNGK